MNDSPIMARPTDPPVAYTVLARRYRPQQFADLIGQEAAAQALVNALKSGRVAHAYLFTGARGVGKTSTARILAKALNCIKGPTPTPCDACDNCKAIASGEDIDVIEIDAASNRGIDESRKIRDNVRSLPSARSRYKIYIIDEVHMLTREAFNALLKTLEEPPAHVKFLFATTEAQRIPITILSRCQRFDLPSISAPRIAERLREVVKGEGLKADDDVLELVARRAGGSMRDAQSLLDQLLAFGGDTLTADVAHRLLGTAGDERVLALADAVLAKDAQRALELVDVAAMEGLQLGELVDQLIAYWRDLMVLHCAGNDAKDLSVAPRHRDTLLKQAKALSLDTILAGLDVLNATRGRLRGSNHGRVLVEMALVRLGRLDDLVSLAQLAHRLTQPGAAPSAPRPAATRPTEPPEGVKKKGLNGVETPAPTTPLALSPQTLPTVWRDVLSQVGPLMARHLEGAGIPAISGPNTLALRFATGYNEACEYWEPPRLKRLEETLARVVGSSWGFRLESVGNGAAPHAPDAATDGDKSPSRSRQTRADVLHDPLFQRATDALGAQVVHVDDGFGAAPAAAPPRSDHEE